MLPSNKRTPPAGASSKKSDQQGQFWLFVAIFLAAACGGFLTVNFLKMITLSHVHVSQGHALHKEAAFNAFVGSNTTLKRGGKPTRSKDGALPYDVAEATKMLTTRVCGSPAVDGYAYVNNSCLEQSPTAQFWRKYIVETDRWDLLVAHVEVAADYDGLAVYWGIGNQKASFQECAQHCLDHRPDTIPGPFEHLPCNSFAWCGSAECFEPDAHSHHKGDCWLKFTESPANPEVNMRGQLPADFRAKHPGANGAPEVVQWTSGVLLPQGVQLQNGTLGPRWWW